MEISEARKSLGEYTAELRSSTLLLTRRGKPVAALVPLRNLDWETITLSRNPRFRAIIARSRRRAMEEGTISHAEMKHRLGIK
jgi:antitoxin (DNA-binding transcriptional repressor) of toxin-antitoxin stability system